MILTDPHMYYYDNESMQLFGMDDFGNMYIIHWTIWCMYHPCMQN